VVTVNVVTRAEAVASFRSIIFLKILFRFFTGGVVCTHPRNDRNSHPCCNHNTHPGQAILPFFLFIFFKQVVCTHPRNDRNSHPCCNHNTHPRQTTCIFSHIFSAGLVVSCSHMRKNVQFTRCVMWSHTRNSCEIGFFLEVLNGV